LLRENWTTAKGYGSFAVVNKVQPVTSGSSIGPIVLSWLASWRGLLSLLLVFLIQLLAWLILLLLNRLMVLLMLAL
jgi:hypothetical protein